MKDDQGRIIGKHGHCKVCGACVELPTAQEIADADKRSSMLADSHAVEICLLCDECVLAYRIRMTVIAQRN